MSAVVGLIDGVFADVFDSVAPVWMALVMQAKLLPACKQ